MRWHSLHFVPNSSSGTANDAATRSATTTTWYEHAQWKSWQPNEPKHDAGYCRLFVLHFRDTLIKAAFTLFFRSTKSVTATTNAIYACAKYESKQYANLADFAYASDNELTIVVSLINVTTFITIITVVDGWSTKSANVGRTKKCARHEPGNDESTWSESQSKHATISITASSANTRNVASGTSHQC